jgi:hypothetical protein
VKEFLASADQGLILAIRNFVKAEKVKLTLLRNVSEREKENVCVLRISRHPLVDMSADLKWIDKPLETIVRGDTDNSSPETKIDFDHVHLSPLKGAL